MSHGHLAHPNVGVSEGTEENHAVRQPPQPRFPVLKTTLWTAL